VKHKIVKSLPGDLQKCGSGSFCFLWTTQASLEEAAVLHSSWGSRLCRPAPTDLSIASQLPLWKTLNYTLFQEKERDSCLIGGDLF